MSALTMSSSLPLEVKIFIGTRETPITAALWDLVDRSVRAELCRDAEINMGCTASLQSGVARGTSQRNRGGKKNSDTKNLLLEILATENRPLTARELMARLKIAGWNTKSQSPIRVISVTLSYYGEFRSLGPLRSNAGLWGMSEWPDEKWPRFS